MNKALSFVFNIVVLAVLAAGGYWVYQNRYDILDKYYLQGYTAPAPIASLANQATLTDYGRRLFYRAKPQIDTDRASLVRDCHIKGDKTIELGCYLSTDSIYLLNIDEPELKDEMVVTSAHETLHAGYDRLSGSEKRRINTLLEQTAATIKDDDFTRRMEDYRRLEPGEEDNELHSILGTEYSKLPPDLEQYYSRYFSNRAQIVSYSIAFNQAFDGLHNQITQLDAEITAQKAQMQTLLHSGKIAAYNSMVPVINAKITSYNAKVQRYNRYAEELLGTQATAPSQ